MRIPPKPSLSIESQLMIRGTGDALDAPCDAFDLVFIAVDGPYPGSRFDVIVWPHGERTYYHGVGMMMVIVVKCEINRKGRPCVVGS